MKITYISHSGFMMELDDTVLLFDYYKGKIPEIEKEKPIYVFASHRHPDHFNPFIFDLFSCGRNIHYFLSSDIKIENSYLQKYKIPITIKEHVTIVGKNDTIRFENKNSNMQAIEIRTLKSTDEGVAFSVCCGGKRIYHAGDLNWWHWNGETKAYNRNMEVNYKKEIDLLSKQHFDIACIPLDPRLENAYDWGIKYFMKNVDVEYVFPMHLWDDYVCIQKLIEGLDQIEREKIINITKEGESFCIDGLNPISP